MGFNSGFKGLMVTERYEWKHMPQENRLYDFYSEFLFKTPIYFTTYLFST